MTASQCSQCGRVAMGLVWGWALLARDSWKIAPAVDSTRDIEQQWLCANCGFPEQALRSNRLSADRQRLPSDRPLKVLVVDDQVLVLRTLARLLTGCDTVTARSSMEAWRLLESGAEFDVIVSDVMMPELTGPELYARCHRHSPGLASRFVFASADPRAAREMIVSTLARLGVVQSPPLLRKPTSRAVLLSIVAAAAKSTPQRSGTYELCLPSELGFERSSADEAPATGKRSGER